LYVVRPFVIVYFFRPSGISLFVSLFISLVMSCVLTVLVIYIALSVFRSVVRSFFRPSVISFVFSFARYVFVSLFRYSVRYLFCSCDWFISCCSL